MIKLYIKRHFDKLGIEVEEDRLAFLADYTLNIDSLGEDDDLRVTATFSVEVETEGTMLDDLESIGLKIANQYVDFIKFCETLKEKSDDGS